jgi:hypothetical protein
MSSDLITIIPSVAGGSLFVIVYFVFDNIYLATILAGVLAIICAIITVFYLIKRQRNTENTTVEVNKFYID